MSDAYRQLAREWFQMLATEHDGVLPDLAAVDALRRAIGAQLTALGEPLSTQLYEHAGQAWTDETGRCFRCQHPAAPCACGTVVTPKPGQPVPAPPRKSRPPPWRNQSRQAGELFG